MTLCHILVNIGNLARELVLWSCENVSKQDPVSEHLRTVALLDYTFLRQ